MRWALEPPWAKVSKSPIRRKGLPMPFSAITSATSLPRPPTTVWFSMVMTP